MTIFIYNKAFVHYNIGEASAASVLVFIVAGLIGAVYMFLAKRESDYAD
jgi:ABC-type sugar transport system permease subunit